MPTGREIAKTATYAIEVQGGYIWGQMGAVWTAAKQAALEKKYNSDPEKYSSYKYSAKYGKKWIGHQVWDCAGLCRWDAKENGVTIHAGSNLIWNCDLSKKGKLSAGLEIPDGALVFTGDESSKPHVGVYTGDGIVTEASGAQAGCIQSKITDKKWKWWGLIKGVEYDFIPGEDPQPEPTPTPTPEPTPEPTPVVKHKTLRRGDKGPEVKEMQELLLAHGEALPRYGADGDFGRETEAAVKNFQLTKKIKVDGICGPVTWSHLLA